MQQVGVIGSGFSGLSAACFLAKAGYNVTVLEKNGTAGGRARAFKMNGFVFDMGPSWYWMPDVFEGFFNSFGKSASDYYSLHRLDPSYRIFYKKDDFIDVPSGVSNLLKLFEDLEPGSSRHLETFLKESKYKYELAIHELVRKPGLSLTELLDPRLLSGSLRLHVFQSMSAYIRKFFKDPRLVQLLEFPVLFLGSTPEKTPALYSLMNYADMALGTWYPQGGMNKIIEAMSNLALSLGVEFKFNCNVEAINLNGHMANGVTANGTLIPYDCIVASADYHHVEQTLLPASYRRYSKKYWSSRTLAPSSLIFYLGINKKVSGLLHHNLFFNNDFRQHAREIYDTPRWPSAPQFYVSCPSKTDATVAPPEHENLFILIPVAPGLDDNENIRDHYFDLVLSQLEQILGTSIREHIIYKRSYAHKDFEEDYNAYKGNAYGLANTLRQTANLKPAIVNKKVPNLFFTGQLTVPGPGVPPAIISGEVVAKELMKRNQPKYARA